MSNKQLNFAVIGPGKCGTSHVYELLTRHPDISLSSAKETLYFESEYHRGADWFDKFYKNAKSEDILGEISNTYVFSPEACKRLHAHNEELKIVSTIRHPVERAFSHYLFLLRNNELTCSFEEALKVRPDLLSRGHYAKHLKPYFDTFGSDSILILNLEDLRNAPDAYCDRLLNHLEVGLKLNDEEVSQTLPASKARSGPVAGLVKKLALSVRGLGFPEVVTKVKRTPLVSKLLYKPYTKADKPRLNPQLKTKLSAQYVDDAKWLSNVTNFDYETLWNL